MPFFENAIELDTYLVSDYPQIVKLADQLFEEVKEVDARRARTKNEKYRSKEVLKIILINLFIAYESGVAIQYSRRKQKYTRNSRYGRIYFKYIRVISTIDALIHLGYADNWIGFYDRENHFSRESRMAATSKLVDFFMNYDVFGIEPAGKLPPKIDDLIQMRDKYKNSIEFNDARKTKDQMTEDLFRYNNFISKHQISFHLTKQTPVNIYFLMILLKNKVNNGIVKITDFITSGFIRTEHVDDIVYLYEVNGRQYLISDGPGSDCAKKYISLSHKVKYSTYKHYYNSYITNKLNINNHSTNNITHNNTSMTGTLIEYNEEIQSVDIENATTVKSELLKRPLSDYDIYSLSFESNYQYLHRVFTIYADQGGRFYGAVHINMPKEVRKCIFIDGEPSCELDYSAHHIRMLYHESKIDYLDDPYGELCEGNLDLRAVYKIVSLVSINAGSENKAIKGIRKELLDKGIHYDVTNESLKACIDKFKEIHKPIANYLNSGYGIHLQYYDSRITNLILMKMTKEGVPCLPVHDSYIVPAKNENDLRETMTSSYQKIIGKEFRPIIK